MTARAALYVDFLMLFVVSSEPRLTSYADEPQCGNGMLDPDEECDYGIAAQFECCSHQCTGCQCGNGRIDPGEEWYVGEPGEESSHIC